ncbi:hypothetical protein VTK73DRAFT_4171 [Phialemonium thermophilum]|uniref:Uncharacterized protein n=1 Tax=Phialemonium thermophilum TaxID=223376 RepID=A0ABR3Y0K0_9PEZI
MDNGDFIDLSGPAQAQAPRMTGGGAASGRTNPPPPPFHPQQPIQQRANAANTNIGHFQQQAQARQQQQQRHAAVPPPPPRHIIPPHLEQGPSVQLSDIRKERMTENEARDELTTYSIFRFEKAGRPGEYDSEGERVKPTWENVYRQVVSGVSKREAQRRIKSLNETTRPLSEKLVSLISAQQRQLDKTLEEITSREQDNRFVTVLAQIDQQIRPKRESKSRDRSEGPARSKDGGKSKKKKEKETVSITAYYKRSPRPGVDAIALVMQRDAELARGLQPPHPHQTFPPQQPHYQQPHFQQPHHNHPAAHVSQPQPAQQQRPVFPQQHGPQQSHGQAAGPRYTAQTQHGTVPQGQGGATKAHHTADKKDVKAAKRSKSRSSRRSSKSSDSDSDSNSDSDSDSHSDTSWTNDDASVETPNSSNPSSQRSHKKGHDKSKKGRRYIESPRHYGVPVSLEPHRFPHNIQHRISDELLRPRSAASPSLNRLPPLSALDLERIKDGCYEAGRADERAESRELIAELPRPRIIQDPQRPLNRSVYAADTMAYEEEAYATTARARPRLPRRIPYPRLVNPADVSIRGADPLDRFDRLRLDDERRYEDRHYMDDYVMADRFRDGFARELDRLDREHRARQYTGRDSESDSTYMDYEASNPFRPRWRSPATHQSRRYDF